MSSASSSDVKLEIGHVLFIDIVGYSKLLITEQSELLRRLNDVVRETEQFRSAEVEGKLVRLPTGDGMALVFRGSPEAPVECALELSQRLKAHPELRVRMGIHSGPVNEVADVNERTNITGAGINLAQRVMDCGDAGHILVSKHVADDLEQYPRWRPRLYEALPDFPLTLLVGSYAQTWHLDSRAKESLTETVQAWREYAPQYIPLPHPSWRNNGWLRKNPWFETELVPYLRSSVARALSCEH